MLHDDNRYAGGVLYVLFKLCFVSDRGEVVQDVELTLVLLSRRACGERSKGCRRKARSRGACSRYTELNTSALRAQFFPTFGSSVMNGLYTDHRAEEPESSFEDKKICSMCLCVGLSPETSRGLPVK